MDLRSSPPASIAISLGPERVLQRSAPARTVALDRMNEAPLLVRVFQCRIADVFPAGPGAYCERCSLPVFAIAEALSIMLPAWRGVTSAAIHGL